MAKFVMIVDDLFSVRQVLRMTLEKEGYQVIEADSVRQALEVYPEDHVDMLITDLNMPEMDGIELIKAIRKKPGARFMPIIMLTSESNPGKKQEGKKAGASGWITKPFRPEQLLAVVRMICHA